MNQERVDQLKRRELSVMAEHSQSHMRKTARDSVDHKQGFRSIMFQSNERTATSIPSITRVSGVQDPLSSRVHSTLESTHLRIAQNIARGRPTTQLDSYDLPSSVKPIFKENSAYI